MSTNTESLAMIGRVFAEIFGGIYQFLLSAPKSADIPVTLIISRVTGPILLKLALNVAHILLFITC